MRIDLRELTILEGQKIIYVSEKINKPYLISLNENAKILNYYVIEKSVVAAGKYTLQLFDFKNVEGMNLKQIIETAKNWETEE